MQDARTSDGYNAVQLGFDDQKEQRLTKPVLGHLSRNSARRQPTTTRARRRQRIREFRDFSKEVKPGDMLGRDAVRRGRFRGLPSASPRAAALKAWSSATAFAAATCTHGAKGWHRRSGAIGSACSPAPSCAA